MLTYRTGAAGAPSAARAMSEHLLQQTLSPEMAAMAEYYQQGLGPPTPAQAAAARYAVEMIAGRLPAGELLDEVVSREADRLALSGTDPAGRPLQREALVMSALGAFVAAGMVTRQEALASLYRTGGNPAPGDEAQIEARLDLATEQARVVKDYSSTTATPRRDMNPALAERLGIDPNKALTASEIASLLNGERADGHAIEGKQRRAGTEGIGNRLWYGRKPPTHPRGT